MTSQHEHIDPQNELSSLVRVTNEESADYGPKAVEVEIENFREMRMILYRAKLALIDAYPQVYGKNAKNYIDETVKQIEDISIKTNWDRIPFVY